MPETPNVAVIYYSATGTVHELAQSIAKGAESTNANVRLARVAELAPDEAIASNPQWAAHVDATKDMPTASPDDMTWADAVIFGSPTRYGNVTSQLQQFIDTLGGLWADGSLADKVYSGFTSSSTWHGGQESTLVSLYSTFYHFGGIVVAPGYTHSIKFEDGNPYGTSHVSGDHDRPVDDTSRQAGEFQGRRVALAAAVLKNATLT